MPTPSNTALSLATIATILAAYLSGVWAIYGHFRTQDRVEPGMKLASLLSLVGMTWFLLMRWHDQAFLASVNVAADTIAIVLAATSMGLFWWAVATTRRRRLTLAFSKDQPSFIHTGGPYGWVRHPFYTSYIIFWMAAAIAAGTALFWIMPAAFFAIYWQAIRIEEGKFTDSSMSGEYQAYRARTGMLFPVWAARQRVSTRP